MLLFDELEKAITSEAKAADNKVVELENIIHDAAKDMRNQQSPANQPQNTSYTFQGRIITSMQVLRRNYLNHKKRMIHFRGRVHII